MRISNPSVGIILSGVGIFGTPLAMIFYLSGSFAGWWGMGHESWIIPIAGFLLLGVGNAIDTHRGKQRT